MHTGHIIFTFHSVQLSPLLVNDSPHPGEGLLFLCYHGARGTHLILHWNKIETQVLSFVSRQSRNLAGGVYEADPCKKKKYGSLPKNCYFYMPENDNLTLLNH